MKTIGLIGCNHRSAPVDLRERLAYAADDVAGALARLCDQGEIEEACILSTCNRIELIVRSGRGNGHALDAAFAFLESDRTVDRDLLDRHLYRRRGEEAVRHLYHVATGLDSLILGEPQILGQVKQAHRIARRAGTTGSVVERLMQQCLGTAKRVRRETGIDRHPVSVAYAAAHLARQIFGALTGRAALVLGAGKMGELVARHLVGAGVERVYVAGRSFDNALLAAGRVGGQAVHWEDGLTRLGQVDVVVGCTGASRPILDVAAVTAALRRRRGAPLFLIDIAVPRDVEPAVNELDNVYLYDIDALQDVVEANLDERRQAAERARSAIDADVAAFARWCSGLEVTPTIVALRETLQQVARDEIERFRRRLGPLSDAQQRVVEELVRAVVQKILHRPTLRLRRAVELGDPDRTASLVREMFDLETVVEPAGRPREARSEAGSHGPQRLLRGGRER